MAEKAEQLVRLADATARCKRYDRMQERRRLWEPTWDELAQLFLPRRAPTQFRLTQPGTRKHREPFDGTGVNASRNLAASIAGTLTSNAFQWFSLKMRLEELNQDYDVQLWLEEVARRIWLGLQQSNFSAESHEFYLDLCIFGTGALLTEEKPYGNLKFNGFCFRAMSPGSYVIAEDPEGRVDTVFRRFPMSLRACVAKWGRDKLSEKTQQRYDKSPDETIEILHAVYPNPDQKTLGGHKPNSWLSCYDEFEAKHELGKKGFHEFPYLVPRWTKASDEEYGRGQGHEALPDMRTLDHLSMSRLKAVDKATDPPMKVLHDGVVGRPNLTPGAWNVVESMDGLAPVEPGAKFDVAMVETNDLRMAVRKFFFDDQFKIPDKQYMTAFEVQQQIELMQRLLGPTLGRMETEYLNPLIDRCFNLLLRAGELPDFPPALLAAADQGLADIDVQYESPLVRSQRTGDLVAMDRATQSIAPIAQVDPTVMDNFDTDEWARHASMVAGLPVKLLRSKDSRDALRAERMRQQKEQATLDQAEQASKAMKNVGMQMPQPQQGAAQPAA